MNPKLTQHPILSFSSLLLFFIFVLFLLPVLILSAETYRASVRGQEQNTNLYTAANYITAKFRQHDTGKEDIFVSELMGYPALCFSDTIEGDSYTTYLYLMDKELKELFTVPGSAVPPSVGTVIADLADFSFSEAENGVFWFSLTDLDGAVTNFALHRNSYTY
ncbi:MAG: DUF4860 domain-containing protein [Blautia sp.]|nr:DUF4860 domain-containing protein [Blautia sp.]